MTGRGRVLVLGGTGAIGVYLVPELLSRGFKVDVTTRSNVHSSDNSSLKYIKGDARDQDFLLKILRVEEYDAIVDFMNYSTDEFRSRYNLMLENCKQYIFLSSYRVFADAKVITEESPRLLDASTDDTYLKTDDYALAKARQEDMLRSAPNNNWTIVRPAITYSNQRFQFGTMEVDTFVWRALQNLPVIMPREMLDKTTTMTWAGDVARLIAKLTLNKKAFGEDYNLATNENHTWEEVAKIYDEIIGLKVKIVELDVYIEAMGGGSNKYQVKYDRMYTRALDNTKVLQATGEKQKDFTTLRDGLRRELSQFVENPHFAGIDYARQARFDKLTYTKINLDKVSPEGRDQYLHTRYPRKAKIKQMIRPRTRIKSILRRVKRTARPRTRAKAALWMARKWQIRQKTKDADGAILTLTGFYNYGNIIQRYALQEFLRQKGYNFVSYWGGPFDTYGHYVKLCQHMQEFIRQRIWRKPPETRDRYKTYVVGSDQVWRNWSYDNEQEELGYYFLDFARDRHVKRITYAASIGVDSTKDALISNEFVDYAKPLIKKFDAISMREASGVKLVKNTWGVKSKLVLDPTALLLAKDYSKLIDEPTSDLKPVKGIFAYILLANDEATKLIKNVSRSTNMEVDAIYPYELDVLPPMEQWLKGYRDADFVVTDSFHGTVFAILNNTPFVVFERKLGGVGRLTSLLGQLGLEDRLVEEGEVGKFDMARLKSIDWKKVNKRIAHLRKESADWLLESLSDTKTK